MDKEANKIKDFLDRRAFLINEVETLRVIVKHGAGNSYTTEIKSSFNCRAIKLPYDLLVELQKRIVDRYAEELRIIDIKVNAIAMIVGG